MSFNLRLPPIVESAAKYRAESMGISLNAIICVALDAYLNQKMVPKVRQPKIDTPPSNTGVNDIGESQGVSVPVGTDAVKLTKKQRQEFTTYQRAQRKLSL